MPRRAPAQDVQRALVAAGDARDVGVVDVAEEAAARIGAGDRPQRQGETHGVAQELPKGFRQAVEAHHLRLLGRQRERQPRQRVAGLADQVVEQARHALGRQRVAALEGHRGPAAIGGLQRQSRQRHAAAAAALGQVDAVQHQPCGIRQLGTAQQVDAAGVERVRLARLRCRAGTQVGRVASARRPGAAIRIAALGRVELVVGDHVGGPQRLVREGDVQQVLVAAQQPAAVERQRLGFRRGLRQRRRRGGIGRAAAAAAGGEQQGQRRDRGVAHQ